MPTVVQANITGPVQAELYGQRKQRELQRRQQLLDAISTGVGAVTGIGNLILGFKQLPINMMNAVTQRRYQAAASLQSVIENTDYFNQEVGNEQFRKSVTPLVKEAFGYDDLQADAYLVGLSKTTMAPDKYNSFLQSLQQQGAFKYEQEDPEGFQTLVNLVKSVEKPQAPVVPPAPADTTVTPPKLTELPKVPSAATPVVPEPLPASTTGSGLPSKTGPVTVGKTLVAPVEETIRKLFIQERLPSGDDVYSAAGSSPKPFSVVDPETNRSLGRYETPIEANRALDNLLANPQFRTNAENIARDNLIGQGWDFKDPFHPTYTALPVTQDKLTMEDANYLASNAASVDELVALKRKIAAEAPNSRFATEPAQLTKVIDAEISKRSSGERLAAPSSSAPSAGSAPNAAPTQDFAAGVWDYAYSKGIVKTPSNMTKRAAVDAIIEGNPTLIGEYRRAQGALNAPAPSAPTPAPAPAAAAPQPAAAPAPVAPAPVATAPAPSAPSTPVSTAPAAAATLPATAQSEIPPEQQAQWDSLGIEGQALWKQLHDEPLTAREKILAKKAESSLLAQSRLNAKRTWARNPEARSQFSTATLDRAAAYLQEVDPSGEIMNHPVVGALFAPSAASMKARQAEAEAQEAIFDSLNAGYKAEETLQTTRKTQLEGNKLETEGEIRKLELANMPEKLRLERDEAQSRINENNATAAAAIARGAIDTQKQFDDTAKILMDAIEKDPDVQAGLAGLQEAYVQYGKTGDKNKLAEARAHLLNLPAMAVFRANLANLAASLDPKTGGVAKIMESITKSAFLNPNKPVGNVEALLYLFSGNMGTAGQAAPAAPIAGAGSSKLEDLTAMDARYNF
jgi:hypothetical protein